MAKKKTDDNLWKALRRTVQYHTADFLGLPIRPSKLRFGLTNRCNSRCVMCSAWKYAAEGRARPDAEISAEEIDTILARNAGRLRRVGRLSLTGGEPTLRRDVIEVIDVLTRRLPKASVNINTNGFDTERILDLTREILERRRQISLFVSLDGRDDVHDRVRGVKGAFARTMATIEGLLAMKTRTTGDRRLGLEINFVLNDLNAGELLPVFEFCRKNRLGFTPIHPVSGELYNNCEADVRLSDAAREAHRADARALLERAPSLHLRETWRLLDGQPRDFDCWAGQVMMLIEDDTTVYPNGGCPASFAMGRLRDHDYRLDRLTRAPQARDALRNVRRCRSCMIPCESSATLRGPEALAGWRKRRKLRREFGDALENGEES